MKIGIRLTGEMSRQPLEENARWAAEHGFADIETTLTDTLAETLRPHGLTAWSANLGRVRLLTADDAEREQAIARAKESIDSAARQGVRVVGSGHAMVEGRPAADQITLFKLGFAPVAEHAERAGVKIAFENWPNRGRNLMTSPELWDAAFSAVDSPALGLTFDPSHLVVLHIDWLWAMRAFKERIAYVHGKDTELFPEKLNRYGTYGPFLESGGPASGIWWRYRLPGFGVIDWRKFADVLSEIGYQGPINIEHEDQVWGFTGDVERMREGLLLTKRFLEQTIG
ncbi:MAG: sugar phosphate isomerase/epimerase [Chloroflexota bacterium]|nr:sugar phosphate isomerase/epimerase [Chloroflexota bacterium]